MCALARCGSNDHFLGDACGCGMPRELKSVDVPDFRQARPRARARAPAISRDWTGFLRRSEERRVGKECRSRWSAYQLKKKNTTTHMLCVCIPGGVSGCSADSARARL